MGSPESIDAMGRARNAGPPGSGDVVKNLQY